MNSYPNSDCKQCTESKLGRVHSAHTQNPCRARSQRGSRAQRVQVARIAPRSRGQVATSFPCQPPSRSRHRFQVATSWTTNPCRDIKLVSRHYSCHFRSQPPNGVATPFLLPSPQVRSRLHFSRSRPPGASPMSRHRFHVATSFLPIVGLPGRDTEFHVATSHTVAHVATSNPCRDAVSAQPKQTRSRRHFLVATSRPTKLGPT